MKPHLNFGACDEKDFPRRVFLSLFIAITLSLNFESFAQPTNVEAWGSNYYGEGTVPPDINGVVAIAAGTQHNLVLKTNGTVSAWGWNNNGQTNVPAGLSNVVALAAHNHSMALKQDGSVIVWGSQTPVVLNVPPSVTNVTAISAGDNYCLALKADKSVVAWGRLPSGDTNLPAGPTNVTAISAGRVHSLALRPDGTVVAWGDNFYGQCDVPGGLNGVKAIAAGEVFSMALKSNGTVVAWGHGDFGTTTLPPGLSGVVAISAGFKHGLALKPDGTVAAWGYLDYLPTPPGLAGVTAISGGGSQNLVLTTVPLTTITAQPQNMLTSVGGTVAFQVSATCRVPLSYQWRRNGVDLPGQTNNTLSWTNAQTQEAGEYVTVISHPSMSITSSIATLTVAPPPALLSGPKDTKVRLREPAFFAAFVTSSLPVTCQWLKNGTNQINVNSLTLGLGNAQPSDVGAYQIIVANASGSITSPPANLSLYSTPPAGTVVTVGGPTPPTDLTNAIAVAGAPEGFLAFALALRQDGTVAAWGNNNAHQCDVPPDVTNVVAIAAGADFSVALKSDGNIVRWGGVSGGGTFFHSNVIALATGGNRTFGLRSDGLVVDVSDPTPIPGISNVVAFAVGHNVGVGVKNDGTVALWGGSPRPSLFAAMSNVVGAAVIRLGGQGLALESDGRVALADQLVAPGQPFPPFISGFSNVVALVGGEMRAIGLKRDGTVIGFNSGALAIDNSLPPGLSNVVAMSPGINCYFFITAGLFFNTQPANVVVNEGENASFSVAAGGVPPFNYQWQKNGTNLSGATASTLSITNVRAADAGQYRAIVNNGTDTATNEPATLSVRLAPVLLTPAVSQTVFDGAVVGFSPIAGGSLPLAYQWQHNGTNIAGATTQNLALSGIHFGDGGNYTLVISNSYDVITSAPVVLTVSPHTFSFGPTGTVMSLGGPLVPPGLTNIVGVAAGWFFPPHSVALRNHGTVVVWGGDYQGKDANVPAGLSNVVAIAAGQGFTLALKRDGRILGRISDASPRWVVWHYCPCRDGAQRDRSES